VGHHRYINFSLGLDPDPSPGRAGGEPRKPTDDDNRRALTAVKKRFEGLKFDGFVITEIRDDLKNTSDRR